MRPTRAEISLDAIGHNLPESHFDWVRVGVGNEVLLLGEQGGAVLDARDLALAAGTIPYEVLTNVSRRVPRVYLNG